MARSSNQYPNPYAQTSISPMEYVARFGARALSGRNLGAGLGSAVLGIFDDRRALQGAQMQNFKARELANQASLAGLKGFNPSGTALDSEDIERMYFMQSNTNSNPVMQSVVNRKPITLEQGVPYNYRAIANPLVDYTNKQAQLEDDQQARTDTAKSRLAATKKIARLSGIFAQKAPNDPHPFDANKTMADYVEEELDELESIHGDASLSQLGTQLDNWIKQNTIEKSWDIQATKNTAEKTQAEAEDQKYVTEKIRPVEVEQKSNEARKTGLEADKIKQPEDFRPNYELSKQDKAYIKTTAAPLIKRYELSADESAVVEDTMRQYFAQTGKHMDASGIKQIIEVLTNRAVAPKSGSKKTGKVDTTYSPTPTPTPAKKGPPIKKRKDPKQEADEFFRGQ